MKVVTEFVGTFIFLLTIALAVANGSSLAPLAIGSALMVVVYMTGHRSGGHVNPAVSLGFFMQRKLSFKNFVAYVVAQVAAGILAFFVGWLFTGKTVPLFPTEDFTVEKALLAEAIYTFLLVLVVLNVAGSRKTEGNSFYGLAIGFSVVIGAIAVGPVSGGAFNPAVGIGAVSVNALLGGGSWTNIWIPIVGPFFGAVLASVLFEAQERSDPKPMSAVVEMPQEQAVTQ